MVLPKDIENTKYGAGKQRRRLKGNAKRNYTFYLGSETAEISRRHNKKVTRTKHSDGHRDIWVTKLPNSYKWMA